jgi:hypothetical protein
MESASLTYDQRLLAVQQFLELLKLELLLQRQAQLFFQLVQPVTIILAIDLQLILLLKLI